jgi:ribose 5-phosphate isomerase A
MVLGLGTGSTTRYAIEYIAEKMSGENLDIVGIPTSIDSKLLAKKLKIPLTNLKKHPNIDLTIDGADEVDPDFILIKGHGGALLREKIVAQNSKQEIIIVDHTKMVSKLGTKKALPVEVLPFGLPSCKKQLERFDCKVTVRKRKGTLIKSDNNNYFLDCKFQSINEPSMIESSINNIPGVIENGLFIKLATKVIVASPEGVKILETLLR